MANDPVPEKSREEVDEYLRTNPVEKPSFDELVEYENEGSCPAIDGCEVETDGTCEHGFPSWLKHLGFI